MLRDLEIPTDDRLMVGLITGDDAGVYRLRDDLAIVQTVDFFTPIVDDPLWYGRIAAANSLSDVYAMGGIPLTAMNILCYPISERDPSELAAILRGGSEKIAESGAVLLGGHSVEDSEPKYGLSVTGSIDPNHITTNAGARAGDAIVLTKPLGTGIVTTAAKYDQASPEALLAACESMAALNGGAAAAMRRIGIGPGGIHAATDITGFALAGHLFHIARESNLVIELYWRNLPVLPEAESLALAGNVTRGDRENRAYIGERLHFAADVPAERQNIVLDPQTSGGLAICVAENRLDDLLVELEREGTLARAVIGRVVAGDPALKVC